MKKNYFLNLLIFLMPLVAFGQSTTGIKKEKWTVFENHYYAIEYPKNWDLDTAHQMQTEFILFSKQTDSLDLFRDNVNLIIKDFGVTNVSLDQYVEGTTNQLKTMMSEPKVLLSERLEKEGLPYHRMIYSGTLFARNLKFEQLFWIEKHKAYVLTLTCAQDSFDSFKFVGRKILNSFSYRR